MHELGIVKEVIHTMEDFAAKNDVTDILGICLEIGELSLVVPRYIEEIYPVEVKGTILENAELSIEEVPGMAECDECDEIFNVIEHKGYCPNCGSFEKTVLTGREFKIKEIYLPELPETAN